MLSIAALQTAATRMVATAFSPSKTCRVRVPAASGSMFRYDPYACRVLASPVKTPVAVARHAAAQEASAVPQANRAFLDILNVTCAPASGPYTVPAAAPRAAVVAAPLAPVAAAAAAPVVAAAAPVVAAAAAPAAAPSAASALTHYAFIRFKHDVLAYVAPFRIAVGDLVLVEGDRGEDIGQVERITTDAPNYPVPLKVTRKATMKDREMLQTKRHKEDAAIRTTQALADSLGLGMQIADCEFQLDYNKLTVFFRSKARHIDFRKLQRGLFREFRCRIWLTESNRHIAAEKPAAAATA